MEENRPLNEILSRVDALDKRLRAMEEYRRNAPDLSEKAMRDMREELDLIRAALGIPGTDRPQAGAVVRQAERDYRTPSAVRRPKALKGEPAQLRAGTSAAGEGTARKAQRLSERNLGKYLLGVLAAMLILLAAGVLISAVWPVIPDILKLAALLACGAGLELAGMRFVLPSEKRRNGFWLSVTGLGAGMSLMAVAAGCLAWKLYPIFLAGVLAAVWFGCNLITARNLDSPVFYVIAYIGAALAVMLSINLAMAGDRPDLAPFRLADQIPAAVMPVLILALGGFAAFRHPRRCLRALNYLAALFFIYILGVFASELAIHVKGYVLFASESVLPVQTAAPGWVIAFAILAIFTYLLYISPDALERKREKPAPDWFRFLAVGVAGFAGIFAVYGGADSVVAYIDRNAGGNPTAAVTAAAAGLAAAAVTAIRRDQIDYLLPGLTVPMTILLASASGSLLELPCLFPVLLCVLLFTLDRLRPRESFQLALRLALGLSGITALSQSGQRMEWYSYGADLREAGYVLPVLAACFTYLAMLLLTYFKELNRETQSDWRHLMSLVCAVFIGLTAARGAYLTMVCFLPEAGPETVYPETAALALLFHRWYVQSKTRTESGMAGLARTLWSLCAGIFLMYLHMCILFSSGLERGVCIMVLTAMAGSSVAWAAASGTNAYVVPSVLFANEALAFAGGVNDVYGLPLSVLGLCLCAGFIWLGFFKELRAMRRLGLAGMILYVIKITLLDVQSSGGNVVTTALGLLFAGLVCFCVSFVYNKLDKKYGGEKRESQRL